MSIIEYKITYPSNPDFVIHDSRGIEAGAETDDASELRIEHIQADSGLHYIRIGRSHTSKINYKQSHAIWYVRVCTGEVR